MKHVLIILILLATAYIISLTQLWILALPAWALMDWIARNADNYELEGLWGWVVGGSALAFVITFL